MDKPMLLCVGLDQKTADAGLKEVLAYLKDVNTPKDMVERIKGEMKVLVAKESMLDQTFIDILEKKKPFSLKNLFMKDGGPPLEDLGVPMAIISGIGPKYVGPLMERFRQGVNKYIDSN